MTHFFDIILLLFVVFFVFGKLRSVLGTTPEVNKIKLVPNTKKATAQKTQEDLSDVDKALVDIKDFDKDMFISACKRVFEIVLESYANNNVANIKPLVNKALFEKFDNAIKEKQAKEQTSFAELIAFKDVFIKDVKILKTVAKISVGFVSEQMNITKDKNGNVVNGDDKFLQTIDDVWTFEKSLTSSSPVWVLISTKK